MFVPTGSPSPGGDVIAYVKDLNQLSLSTPFYPVLVSVSVFMVLSTVFHFINSPDKSPFSHSVLAVLSLPYSPEICMVAFSVKKKKRSNDASDRVCNRGCSPACSLLVLSRERHGVSCFFLNFFFYKCFEKNIMFINFDVLTTINTTSQTSSNCH